MLADLHTARGTATGPDGRPITAIKLPHVGGHEGVGRIIAFGPSASSVAATTQDLQLNTLVGIRFLASVCHACEYCLSGREQHCVSSRNHLHHIDGSFQEYTVLDRAYLTVLPQDVDPRVIGPVLCAGLTTFKVRGFSFRTA
jgi:alcohol dehydrogenase, propanol-preferring